MMTDSPAPPPGSTVADTAERWEALAELEAWLDRPMIVLSFVWLALFVVEFTQGLSPFLDAVEIVIWALFILDFLLRLALAPDKLAYLRANWLTALSLFLPAVRVLRVFRVFRTLRVLRAFEAAPGFRLVKVVGTVNRAVRALGSSFGRRGVGYVAALTVLVALAGAAGMYAFERDVPRTTLTSYGSSLWWTAMVLTTMGSDYFPRTSEGRALCLLLAVFGFTVFGYVTAALATFFVGRDAADPDAEVAGQESVDALRAEIAGLRADVLALRSALAGVSAGPAPRRTAD